MPDCDVLVLGDYFCDLIITGLKEVPRLGAEIFGDRMEVAPGGAYILTTALHRLGIHAAWRARLGDDVFSQFILSQALKEGLDQSFFQIFDAPYRSMSLSFSFVHDRGFISYTDPAPYNLPYDLVTHFRPKWVVNLPFDGADDTLNFARHIHENGGQVLSDCQYVTQTLQDPGIAAHLKAIDVFAPNQSEARQLTGESDPVRAAQLLAEYCPLVIIKCGPDGAYAQQGGNSWHSPALPVVSVDTTGAGDSFNAGFLAALLHGKSIQECLRYGNICGGLSVTRCGGASAAPTIEQLKQYL